MSTVDAIYLEYLLSGSIAFKVVFCIWTCFMTICTISGCSKYVQSKKLYNNGSKTNGMVINKSDISLQGNHHYSVQYIFNTESSMTKSSTLNTLLIDGYSKQCIRRNTKPSISNSNSNPMQSLISHNNLIPISIINLISKYYANNKYNAQSIVGTTLFYVNKVPWSTYEVGSKIEILYDPQHPKLWNTAEYDSKSTRYKHYAYIGPLIFLFTVGLYCGNLMRKRNEQLHSEFNLFIELISCVLWVLTICVAVFIAIGICMGCVYMLSKSEHEVEHSKLETMIEMEYQTIDIMERRDTNSNDTNKDTVYEE